MRIESLLADAPIMIAVVKGPAHVLEFANPPFLAIFGDAADLIGKPVHEALPYIKGQFRSSLLKKVFATGKAFIDYERHLVLPSGREYYFNIAFQPVKSPDGTVDSIYIYGMDVTGQVTARHHESDARERRITEQTSRLKRQNDELLELNTSKDEFIALASHQLRTPATGVKQYIGMLLEGYVGELNESQMEFLQQAYNSNERQLATINDLLQIAQIDANKIVLDYADVDIAELVRDVVREQHGNIERRGQHIAVTQAVGDMTVRADKLRLRMVLDNLVDNASKYSRDGTTITITLGVNKRSVTIAVADQGVGIDPADHPKLFQKFSRIDNPLSIVVGGNGLGLYLAKRIIDAHHGSINVTSQPQQGTTFTVSLPRNT